VVEITNSAPVGRTSLKREVVGARPQEDTAPPDGDAFTALTKVAARRWRELAERAVEPNGYYLPGWELAVNAFATGRTGVSALSASSVTSFEPDGTARLIGLMPAISLWRAYRIPLPALANADPYGTLGTPLLDRDMANDAATSLLTQARKVGAHVLILRNVALDGAAMKAITEVSAQAGLRPRVLRSRIRACLDATRDSDALLREALGAKKLKELRRQRHRLAEHGEVRFEVARTVGEVGATLEIFLKLEASGWKGTRGTALAQNNGDRQFIRHATAALAAAGQCEIITLRAGDIPITAGIVLRHQDRAFFFKIGVDERFAKFSPGVQLTLDLTRHLCADPAIASADSTASPDHPMINPIWRGRFAIGDVLIPLRAGDPVAAVIHAAMAARNSVLGQARRAVRFIRAQRV
jgi:CelD/BcsL family acetyltransferase involved in cellulose biosynthesis